MHICRLWYKEQIILLIIEKNDEVRDFTYLFTAKVTSGPGPGFTKCLTS